MFTSIEMITITIFIIIIINITIMIMVIAADLKDRLLSCYKLQTTSHASVLSRLLRIVLMVIVMIMVILVIVMMILVIMTVITMLIKPSNIQLRDRFVLNFSSIHGELLNSICPGYESPRNILKIFKTIDSDSRT